MEGDPADESNNRGILWELILYLYIKILYTI